MIRIERWLACDPDKRQAVLSMLYRELENVERLLVQARERGLTDLSANYFKDISAIAAAIDLLRAPEAP